MQSARLFPQLVHFIVTLDWVVNFGRVLHISLHAWKAIDFVTFKTAARRLFCIFIKYPECISLAIFFMPSETSFYTELFPTAPTAASERLPHVSQV